MKNIFQIILNNKSVTATSPLVFYNFSHAKLLKSRRQKNLYTSEVTHNPKQIARSRKDTKLFKTTTKFVQQAHPPD